MESVGQGWTAVSQLRCRRKPCRERITAKDDAMLTLCGVLQVLPGLHAREAGGAREKAEGLQQ